MKISQLIATLALLSPAAAIDESGSDIKLGIVSDLHLSLNYDPDSSENKCNRMTSSLKQFENELSSIKNTFQEVKQFLLMKQKDHMEKAKDQKALLGRLGCDAPKALVEYILELFNKVNKDEPVDYIILNGDLIAHGVAQDIDTKNSDSYDPEMYVLLQETHRQVASLFTQFMPNTPVFLTFGNNDCKYHDNSPVQEDKKEYFDFMFDIWFNQHPGNVKYKDQVETTFKAGGYYEIKATDNVSFLAVNTLMFNRKQNVSELGSDAINQFNWLTKKMTDSSGQKYVIFTHIYAGSRVKHSDKLKMSDLWDTNWNKKYFDLLKDNKDRLVIELAGHDHWEDLRMYLDKDGNAYRNMFVATGVGMDHNQLPGFNTMKIDGKTSVPKDLKEYILDITPTFGMDSLPKLDELNVRTVDFAKDFGIEDLTPQSIYKKMQGFEGENIDDVLHYMTDKLGYDHTDKDLYQEGLSLLSSWSLTDKNNKQANAFFCQSTRGRTKGKLDDCYKDMQMQNQNAFLN